MLLNKLYEIIIICLISTIIIELFISILLKVKNKKDLLNIILVNIMTNPIVVVIPYVVYLYYGIIYRHVTLLILEILTIFFEGFTYKKVLKYNKINCYILSIILNISSYLIGLIISKIIW